MQDAVAIRGGSGLGDAIYLQSVVRHLVEQGHNIEVCTDWPDVYRQLGGITLSPFRRDRIDLLGHYSMRRGVAGTTQFEDCCIQAGIRERIEFDLQWSRTGRAAERLSGIDRPIIAVQMPRPPFGRHDGFGMEFLPKFERIQAAIDHLRGRACLVQIGSGPSLHEFAGIYIDLRDKTSVCDLFDIATAVDGFLGYCSFIIPLAEALFKPVFCIWSRRGLLSPQRVVRQMTPQKILHRTSSTYVIDDCSDAELFGAVNALYHAVGSPAMV